MTTESSKINTSVLDSNSCLVWLDRSNKDLLQWKRALESYLFEPTTQGQFELKQRLTDTMQRLLIRYKELATEAGNNGKLVGNQVEMIKKYMMETRELEDGVQEYMVMLHPAS